MFLAKRASGDLFDLFREVENQFRQRRPLFARAGVDPGTEESDWVSWYPAVESFTRDGHVVLRAEIPGVDPDKVDVTLHDGRLTIRGEKGTDLKVKESDVYLREIARGRFDRSFTLPKGIKSENVKARHVNGVLEISVPLMNEEEQARKIPIETSNESKPQKTI